MFAFCTDRQLLAAEPLQVHLGEQGFRQRAGTDDDGGRRRSLSALYDRESRSGDLMQRLRKLFCGIAFRRRSVGLRHDGALRLSVRCNRHLRLRDGAEQAQRADPKKNLHFSPLCVPAICVRPLRS